MNPYGHTILRMAHARGCINVGALDDDALALAMIRRFFAPVSGAKLLWTTRYPTNAVQFCVDPSTCPSVVLIDMELRSMTGGEVCRQIRQLSADIRCIGITSYCPESYEEEALSSGLEQVIGKDVFEQILHIVRHPAITVHSTTVVGDQVLERQLSQRELQVIHYLAQGQSGKQIMETLGISKGTLYSYVARAMRKLGAETKIEAACICMQRHLFER